MAIQKLPKDVRSSIRSGLALASTSQCITELVLNSLDAGANSIIIRLDIPQFKLEVDDNGCGITLDDLQYVGNRYHTSKCRTLLDLHSNLNSNGYRGEALASLSESCRTLLIVTRPKLLGPGHTFQKSFNCGKPHKPVRNTSDRKSCGTTIAVQDFMYNAPVRQKRIIPNIDVEEIRVQVEGLALSHPHVSFTIVDESEKSIVRQIPCSSCSLETFSHLYGQEITKDLCPIGPLTLGKLNINGYISRSSHHNKRLQFIFVNGRLVKGTKLHKLINMIMRKSDVLRGNGPWQELPMPERVRDFLWVSPLKKKDRFCVFMVNISCPVTEYDITLDPKKTLIEFCDWETLLECMENVVKNFLKDHNLACVALDQVISNSQSSDDSPVFIINEMEQLEREDVLGQKLSQFKYPKEISRGHRKETIGESKPLKMARAICSIPAKRNLRFPFGKSITKRQPLDKEKTNGGGDVNDKIQTSNREHSFCSEVGSKKAGTLMDISSDCAELITYPLLPDSDLEMCTPVQHLDESKKNSYQFGLKPSVEDSGIGSLGKFRKNFKKTQALSQKTPDDVQKIKASEPPPIIRRPAPLEHRVKGCWNVQLLKRSGIITETFSKVPGKIDMHTKGPISEDHMNSSTFANTLMNNTRENGDVGPKNTSSRRPCTSSGNILKTDAMTSTFTQTENGSLFVREPTNVQAMVEGCIKPNLKNLNLRMKLFQSNFGSKEKIEVFKCDKINKSTEDKRHVEESLNNPHTSSMPVLIGNNVSNDLRLLSRQCESSELSKSKKFLTSEDFICSLEKEKKALGEDYNGCIADENYGISTEKCPNTSVFIENSSSDCEQTSEHMPVLEPYFNSADFGRIPALCDLNDTPPRLLELKNHPIQPYGVELSTISGCSKTTRLDGQKRKPFDMLTEECSSSKHFKDFGFGSESSAEEELKRSQCLTSHKTKPESYVCNRSPLAPSSLHNRVTENNNWVTVDSSSPNGDVAHIHFDSSLDQTLEDSTLKYAQNSTLEESLPHCLPRDKNGHFTQLTESEVCAEIVLDSNSEFSSSDSIGVQLKQYTPYVDNGSMGSNKRQCLQYFIPNSTDDSSPLISSNKPSKSPDGGFNSPKSQKGNMATGDKVTLMLFQGTQDQSVTSPFFGDSADWDAALSKMCSDLECQKATDGQKCRLYSILGQNNDEKLQNKNNSSHQEERFEMFARQPFLPKGLSPVMPMDLLESKMKDGACYPLSPQAENDLHIAIKESSVLSDELAWIKWSGEKEKGPMKGLLCRNISELDKSGKRIMKSFLSGTEDDKIYLESEVLSARIENQSKDFIKVFNLIYPCTFSKDILTNFKMLGKLDRKFIVAKIGLESESVSTPIVLFDQHAVHERIRLERLIQEYQVKDKGNGSSGTEFIRFKSVPITSTLEISLSITEARLMESFHENFEKLGLVFDINLGDGIGSNDAIVKIIGIPACLSSKELKESGPLGLKEQVHSLIREQAENLMVTRGIGTFSPAILREAINMKACRGAVKFGDSLTDQECRWLLKKLSACDTPFQCAHGRPSMYPIVDLKHLGKFCHETKQDIKPRLWKLKKMMDHVKAFQDKC